MGTVSAAEYTVRGIASRKGYAVKKKRVGKPTPENHGLYQLIDRATGQIVLGASFDASLELIKNYLSEKPKIAVTTGA